MAGWEEGAGLTAPRPLGCGGSGGHYSPSPAGPQEPLLQTRPSCLQLQPRSQDRFPSSRCVGFFFPVLHIVQVHENRTFQLSSSTEKWSEVFLSESIFLSDELSLQHRSPYPCDSDAGLSLVIESGRRSNPSWEQAGGRVPLKAHSPLAWGSRYHL